MKRLNEEAMMNVVTSPPRPSEAFLDHQSGQAQRRQDWASKRLLNQERPVSAAAERPVKCAYCLDRLFILLPEDWVIDEQIPAPELVDIRQIVQMNPERGCVRVPGPYDYMVPCDCHPGAEGTGKAKKFHHIFGHLLSFHWLGDAIRDYRRERHYNDRLRPKHQVIEEAGRLAAMAQAQPDEPEDPPENDIWEEAC